MQMGSVIQLINNGGVSSANGFLAGATYAGIKTAGDDVVDLGILHSELPCTVAGTFTQNKVISPSVALTKQRVVSGLASTVVANSGCANCAVGEQGLVDAQEMTALTAVHVGAEVDQTLVASTGVIGVEMPMALVRQNIGNVTLSQDGGNTFARSIMTTDTHPKEPAISVQVDGRAVTIGGCAKGSGMIHPNMATMLAFVTTDAPVEKKVLQTSLANAVNLSFNMIDVDGDQSTNDTVLVLANGKAGGPYIPEGSKGADTFQEGLSYVCTELAKELARDGEGASTLVEVTVSGAQSIDEARVAAREISSSLLVKAMVYGRDPNWGRVMMALGKSGADFKEASVDVYINGIHIVHQGMSISYLRDSVVSSMNQDEVQIGVRIGEGPGHATAWGCDLTEGYVIENSAYTT